MSKEETIEEMQQREQDEEDYRRRMLAWEKAMNACTKTLETFEELGINQYYFEAGKILLLAGLVITLWVKL